jgi:mono/diheme cytochrome c family protein
MKVLSPNFHRILIFSLHTHDMKRGLGVAVIAIAALALRAYVRPPAPAVVRAHEPPIATTAEARGRLVYERYGCVMCHGADGKGGFANPNAETDSQVPAIIFVKEGYTPVELARVIRNGAPTIGRADPKGPAPPYRMPSWDDRMSTREVDDLVQYLLSLYPETAGEQWR